jgi:multiple sugar transport system ATP-binding protein
MAKVELVDVVKRFGDMEVVHGINLQIEENEFIVLVGPSGCGKSTTLRMIAGLESISAGEIRIGDRVINDVPPKDRNIAMVFQNYALYPHMTVFENMAFSLKMQKRPKREIEHKVRETSNILGLGEMLQRKPASLSGGQRQRVAMGRAIVRRPDVFLFDEPLSNLDAQLRTQMRMELKKLHLQLQTTTIYVTHDQIEAMTLADRIVILKDGYIQQVGSPVEVYENPVNIFVAKFIGNPPMNIFSGQVRQHNGGFILKIKDLALPLPAPKAGALQEGAEIMVGLRPDALKAADSLHLIPEPWRFEGEVVIAETLGGHSLLEVLIGENAFIADLEGRILPRPGAKMYFGLDLTRLHLFDPRSNRAVL